VLLADPAAFAQRMGHAPERVAERRAAWQALADTKGVALVTGEPQALQAALAG